MYSVTKNVEKEAFKNRELLRRIILKMFSR